MHVATNARRALKTLLTPIELNTHRGVVICLEPVAVEILIEAEEEAEGAVVGFVSADARTIARRLARWTRFTSCSALQRHLSARARLTTVAICAESSQLAVKAL